MGPRLEPSKRTKQESRGNVAAAYLALLADRGVDYLFGNAGTDFAPLIEGYSQAAQTGVTVPQPILATHDQADSLGHTDATNTEALLDRLINQPPRIHTPFPRTRLCKVHANH